MSPISSLPLLARALPLLRAGACVLSIGLVAVGARAVLRPAAAPALAAPSALADPTPATPANGSDAPLDPAAPDEVSRELQIMVAGASLGEGDAPGTDSRIAPRPQASIRLIDAPLGASGARIRVYSTTRPAPEVMAEVGQKLRESGFSTTRLSTDPYTSTYARGRTQVLARFSLKEERVLVSLVESELRTTED